MIEFIELDVLTYLKDDAPEINYADLGIPEPKEENLPLSWQRRYFNIKVLNEEMLCVFSEKKGETVIKYFSGDSMIVKGELNEILELLS